MDRGKIDEAERILRASGRVTVADLSGRLGVSEVSVRKYLTTLERRGIARRFYGGAELAPTEGGDIYDTPRRRAFAREARRHINDGDSIFVGSGRTCCVLARELAGLSHLTVFTNNITALPDLIAHAARVYLIGGEVTSTDSVTLFASWGTSQDHLENIFVNKAFTSISGVDRKAGLTVDSAISTPVFERIPRMAHEWYLMADATKFDTISIYPVAPLSVIHTLITDVVPEHYRDALTDVRVRVVSPAG